MVAYKDVEEEMLNNPYGGNPHGWLQWKGTDVCMDFRCQCGWLTHLDGDFAYFVKCGTCGQIYAMNGYVRAVPVDDYPENDPMRARETTDDDDPYYWKDELEDEE